MRLFSAGMAVAGYAGWHFLRCPYRLFLAAEDCFCLDAGISGSFFDRCLPFVIFSFIAILL